MRHEKLIQNVCDFYKIDSSSILQNDTKHNISKIRREIMFVMYNFLDYERKEISSIFNMQVQSIDKQLEKVQNDFEFDKKYRQLLISYLDEI
jgi:chromosomal replication initiation ATPase DnaA